MTEDLAGKIHLGSGQWANLGAEGSHLLAELFGEYGLLRIWSDHRPFAVFTALALVTGIVAPLAKRFLVSKQTRHLFPDTVLIGLAQFPPANAVSCTRDKDKNERDRPQTHDHPEQMPNQYSVLTGLAFCFIYQVYLKNRHSRWYEKFQMVSTTGMNTGVGIGGLFMLLFNVINLSDYINPISLGGVVGDGCNIPPQYVFSLCYPMNGVHISPSSTYRMPQF